MKFGISGLTNARATVESIERSLQAIVALGGLAGRVVGAIGADLSGGSEERDAFTLVLTPRQTNIIETDPLQDMRKLVELAVEALLEGRGGSTPAGVALSILRNCPDAARRDIGAFWNGPVIHLHPALSSDGAMALLRHWIAALSLVKCEPSLLPDLREGISWNDVLQLDSVIGAGSQVFTGTLDGYSISKGNVFLRVGTKTETIFANAAMIAEVVEQARDGATITVVTSVTREVLLPKRRYHLQTSARGAEQADLSL